MSNKSLSLSALLKADPFKVRDAEMDAFIGSQALTSEAEYALQLALRTRP